MITYKVDSSVNVEVSKNNYVEAGIVDNLELKSIRYAVTDKGNEFIEFVFEDETGAKLIQTEYKPKGNTEEQELERTLKQIKRIKQIICGYNEKDPKTYTFVNPSDYNINATSFESFAKETIRILGNKNVGKKVRVKAVYNDNGFVTLPKYSTYAFIEPMSLPKDKSIIKELSIDKFKRPEATANTNQSSANVFDTVAAATKPQSVDDLPF